MSITKIRTDEQFQSTLHYGNADFSFAHYCDHLDLLQNRSITLHWHRSFEFSLVESGTVLCEVNGKKIYLQTSDGIFVNSGTLHSFQSASPEESAILQNILFAPEFLAPADSLIYQEFVMPLLTTDLPFFVLQPTSTTSKNCLHHVKTCYAYAEEADDFAPLRIHGEINELWLQLLPQLPLLPSKKGHPSKVTQARMHRMLEFIHQNYHQKITLAEIAHAASVSKRETLRCFSDSLQQSPIQYLNEYRLARAAYLLETTTASITTIALETGFDNSGYFCKVFKKHHGISPMTYRKQMQGEL